MDLGSRARIAKLALFDKNVRPFAKQLAFTQGNPLAMGKYILANLEKTSNLIDAISKDPLKYTAVFSKKEQANIKKFYEKNKDKIDTVKSNISKSANTGSKEVTKQISKYTGTDKIDKDILSVKDEITKLKSDENSEENKQKIKDLETKVQELNESKTELQKQSLKNTFKSFKDKYLGIDKYKEEVTGLKNKIEDLEKKKSTGAELTPQEQSDLNKYQDKVKELEDNIVKTNQEQTEKVVGKVKSAFKNLKNVSSGIVNDVKSNFRTPQTAGIKQESNEEMEFGDASTLLNDVNTISAKLRNKSPITLAEYNLINNIDVRVKELKDDFRYNKDENYTSYVDQLEKAVEKNITNADKGYIEENKEKFVKDPDNVYFEDYIGFFKLCLSLFTYLSIVLIIGIILISIVGLFKLIYDIIVNVISLFVNRDNLSRGISLDYSSKTITRCTKDNFDDDRFFILTEQKQNLVIFNIGIYVLYLLLIYFFLYLILFIYTKILEKNLIGKPQALFEKPIFLVILGAVILYSCFHLVVYKFIFKQYVYSAYKNLQKKEKEIDEIIAKYILIYADLEDGNKEDKNNIIVDHKFFDILYDASRIDELNEIFLDGIKNEDTSKCLEQKIIIYNLYCYLHEYIPFTKDMQDKFKDYCTSTAENKPKFTNSDISMSFVAMMNNNEVKMIRKYNESLNYYNQIPDDKVEYFNTLNESITTKINDINRLILTNTNTMIPFFFTIFYVIFIVILNLLILYTIITIVMSNPEDTMSVFNKYILMILVNVNKYFYEPIIKYIMKFIGGNK